MVAGPSPRELLVHVFIIVQVPRPCSVMVFLDILRNAWFS